MHLALTPPAWWDAQWDSPDDQPSFSWLLTGSDGLEEWVEPADLEQLIATDYATASFTLQLVA